MKRGLLDRHQDTQQCIWDYLTTQDAAKKSSYVAKQQKRTWKYSITLINDLTYCFLDCFRSNLFLKQILASFLSSSVSAWSVFLSAKLPFILSCWWLQWLLSSQNTVAKRSKKYPKPPPIASLFNRHHHSLLYHINYFVDCLFLKQSEQRELIFLLISPNFTIYSKFALTGAVQFTGSLLSKHHRKFGDFWRWESFCITCWSAITYLRHKSHFCSW